MNLLHTIKRPFSDIKKLIIGMALSLIPIVHWFAQGYIFESLGLEQSKKTPKKGAKAGKAKKSDSSALPEWDNWGRKWVKGFLASVIGVLYAIPAILILVFSIGALILSLITIYIGDVIPMGTLESAAAGNEEQLALIESIIEENWAQAIPALVATAPLVILAVLVFFISLYLVPAAVFTYLSTGEFSSAFRLRTVCSKAFSGAYFLAAVVSAILMVILGITLGWLWVVGPAFISFAGGMMVYTLLADAYKQN